MWNEFKRDILGNLRRVCLQSFQSAHSDLILHSTTKLMASEITLNDEASQSFALSHDSPRYCETVIPFYATLSRRITEVRVFWSQECLETAHICLPVKTLIFNEPAKVTPRTLMCCHPQQARSICQPVKSCSDAVPTPFCQRHKETQ